MSERVREVSERVESCVREVSQSMSDKRELACNQIVSCPQKSISSSFE